MGKPANPGARALVADIGGTNARFALADLETLDLSEIGQFPCAEHASIEAAAEIYLAGLKERPCRGAVAVAAPLAGGKIKLTNSAWSFTAETWRAPQVSTTFFFSTTLRRSLCRCRICALRSCIRSRPHRKPPRWC